LASFSIHRTPIFNGGALGAATFCRGGVHGTWFWVDPTYDIVVVGMLQQQDDCKPQADPLNPNCLGPLS